jgi:Flp pilus assembly protein TadG
MDHADSDRGASTVEFAFIVPLLLVLVLAVVEFGFRYQQDSQLNNAAFIAARDMTINHDVTKATAAARNAGAPATATVTVSPTTCSTGTDVTVTITSTEVSATKAFGSTFTITGKGVARCDG